VKRIVFSLLLLILTVPLLAYAAPDSLKICALRVDFKTDQNEFTSGNGRFLTDSVTTDTFAIDPAPHTRLYFMDQIQAAANYYRKVSQGRLLISGNVFPLQDDAAFHLPHEMGFYNPNTTENEINKGLAALFRDALQAADTSGESIDFSQYDLVVIFHAGTGKDIALDYDPTPQDIASLYITKDFLHKTLGNDFDGVAVNNGRLKISSGIIMPETENQEGYQLALTGMLVSNIGSYLGLYDLFSASSQRSGVGRFGLMDAGLFNAGGLIPAPPCAFSRVLLGWEQPQVLKKPANAVTIRRAFSTAPASVPTTVQIPINDDEYFLLENRGDPKVDIDSLYNELSEGRSSSPSYLQVLKAYFKNKIEISPRGVLLSVPDYDWGLPGAGILIWHIDERVIAEKGAENKINDDPNDRAVNLKEADGSQDIGQSYSFFDAGYGKSLGWFADFWFSNRPSYLKDFELYQNEFSPLSRPNSNANFRRANSHITLKNFSANQKQTMTFDFMRDDYAPGFPLHLTQTGKMLALIVGTVVNQQGEVIFCASSNGKIFAVKANGAGLFFSNKKQIARCSASDSLMSLALGQGNKNGQNDILAVAGGDSLIAYSLTNISTDSLLQPIWAIGLPAPILSALVYSQSKIFTVCANDSLYALDMSTGNTRRWSVPHGTKDIVVNSTGEPLIPLAPAEYMAVAPLARTSRQQIIYSAADNRFQLFNPSASETDLNLTEAMQPTGQFALADVNGNGNYDLVFNDPAAICAINNRGNVLTNFPLRASLTAGETLIGTPLIADLNGDNQPDFIAATNQGQLVGLDVKGQPIAGFPLATGGHISLTPLLADLENSGKYSLLALTDSGTLYAWHFYSSAPLAQERRWTQANRNAANNIYISTVLNYRPVAQGLMPNKTVFNYPNPNRGSFTNIRYYLNDAAKVTIKIYDTAGTPVDAFEGPGRGGAANEIRWDVSTRASGVYLCKIQADSGRQTAFKIIKIMVIH